MVPNIHAKIILSWISNVKSITAPHKETYQNNYDSKWIISAYACANPVNPPENNIALFVRDASTNLKAPYQQDQVINFGGKIEAQWDLDFFYWEKYWHSCLTQNWKIVL